ncbi:hypothetical protein GF378_00710 [Candidatus Pacearchaeota archaeon]|nr:hypothetical protein [Candidatus Pacearchaeota archaeon]
MRHIDDKKDENILRARKYLKTLKERGISSHRDIRNSEKISSEELKDIVSGYSTLFYSNEISPDNLDEDRAYRMAEDLYIECEKVHEKNTREEFDIAVKIARLETASGDAERRGLIDYINTKMMEYNIPDDSDIKDKYNKALERFSGSVNEGQQEEETMIEREARRERQEQEKRNYDEKYKIAKQNASEKGEFWPELVDYVYSRLEQGSLEWSLSIGFPDKVDNGYKTKINYIFLNKNFKDELFEENDRETTPGLIRSVRENAAETGRENLESVLGTDVLPNVILFH